MIRVASQLPWGVLGTVLLVAAVEAAFARVEMWVLLPQNHQWRNAANLAKSSEIRTAHVLAFGDSLMKLGLAPPTVEATARLRSYNLAVAGGRPAVSHALLRRVLRAGARPAAVVLESAPHLMSEPPGTQAMLRLAPDAIGLADLLEYGWTARNADLCVRLASSRVCRTLRARDEIRALARRPSRGALFLNWWNNAIMVRHERVNRGAMLHRPDPHGGPPVIPAAYEFYKEFSCQSVNAVYLEKFLTLAESHRIATYYYVPPLSPEVQAHNERNGYDEAHTAFIRSLQARHPGLVVLDARKSGYGRDQFIHDPFHLDGDAASSISRDVARIVRNRLDGRADGRRWINLPAFDERSARGLAVATGCEEYESTGDRLAQRFGAVSRGDDVRQAAAPGDGAARR
jgi:hypothetical protein